jgi:hypothetical protein
MAIANAFNNDGGTGANPGQSFEIVLEDLTSSVNGERTEFSCSQNYDANSLIVYVNGLRQRQSTVGQVGQNGFSISPAPISGDILEVEYTIQTQT